MSSRREFIRKAGLQAGASVAVFDFLGGRADGWRDCGLPVAPRRQVKRISSALRTRASSTERAGAFLPLSEEEDERVGAELHPTAVTKNNKNTKFRSGEPARLFKRFLD